MNKIVFSKYEGLGNDFIVIDESQEGNRRTEPSISLSLRRAICDRKTGVGADGVITLLPPVKAGSFIFMHVTNADGSIPENCGNGLRCVARFLSDTGRICDDQTFYIDTFSGAKKTTISKEKISVELGLARVTPDSKSSEIADLLRAFASLYGIKEPTVVGFVDLGNPHFILETDEIDLAQRELGPKLEKASVFREGANVSFVTRLSAESIALRVWERGAGATDACGSGACASVAVFLSASKLKEGIPIAAHFTNGELSVMAEKRAEFEYTVELRGPARKIFEGIWENLERICY